MAKKPASKASKSPAARKAARAKSPAAIQPAAKAAAPVAVPAQAVEVATNEAFDASQLEARAASISEAATAAMTEAAKADVEPIKQFNEGKEEMVQEAIQATQANAEKVQAVFGDVNARTKAAFDRNAKLVEEVTELTKGNVEALVASSKIVARGVESLGQEVAEYGRKSFEEASAALKSFAEVKSPADLFRLQSEYAKSAFDSVVAEGSRFSEALIKLSGEVAEPITSRYSLAAERVKTLVAA